MMHTNNICDLGVGKKGVHTITQALLVKRRTFSEKTFTTNQIPVPAYSSAFITKRLPKNDVDDDKKKNASD